MIKNHDNSGTKGSDGRTPNKPDQEVDVDVDVPQNEDTKPTNQTPKR